MAAVVRAPAWSGGDWLGKAPLFFWNLPPAGESEVRAAHAPFSESGFSAPVKSDDAIGPAAIAVIGMSIAHEQSPNDPARHPKCVVSASHEMLTSLAGRAIGKAWRDLPLT